MAQIDSSIYFQRQTPDYLGSITRGVEAGARLSDLAKQRRLEADQNAEKEAFQNSVVQNPDGSTSLNRSALLSNLYKINPQKAADYQQQFANQDAAQFEMARKKRADQMALLAQAAGAAVDQPTYEQSLKFLQQNGIDISQMPTQYDEKLVRHYQLKALSAKEQMEQQNKDRDYGQKDRQQKLDEEKNKRDADFKKQELGFKGREVAVKEREAGVKEGLAKAKTSATGSLAANLTYGQKATDHNYAKDFNDWTSTGRSALEKNLQRLRDAKAALQSDSSLTGPARGSVPDVIRNFTNEKAIQTRDDVRAAAQGALKATLGAQFTEKEGERIMNQAYNERLSPEANIAKIDAAIRELETNRENNDRKARYFQKYGTLKDLDTSSILRSDSTPASTANNFHDLSDADLDQLYKQLGGK